MISVNKTLFKKIRRIEMISTRLATDVLSGGYRSAFKGKGMEFEEVREYQSGDDIRSIDWNVTARMNHPYIKIFREERDLSVMLVVDISASTLFGSREQKSEWIAEISALIAFSAIKNQDKVGLILFSNIIELYVPPAKGSRHVLRIIRELLVFKPKQKKSDIQKALSFFGNVQKSSGICFLISDFLNGDFSHEAALVAKKHDLIAISVTDPLEHNFPAANLVSITDLETGARTIVDTNNKEVQKHFRRSSEEQFAYPSSLMKKIGGEFIDIRTDRSYLIPLQKFFKMRKEYRR